MRQDAAISARSQDQDECFHKDVACKDARCSGEGDVYRTSNVVSPFFSLSLSDVCGSQVC